MRAMLKRALGIGPRESEIQVAVMQWAKLAESTMPQLALLHAIPNGGRRDKAEAAHLAAQGVRAGIPDLHLPVSRGTFHSLYIELKAAKGTLSPEQKRVLPLLAAEGNLVVVARDIQPVCELLRAYLVGGMIETITAIAQHKSTVTRVFSGDFVRAKGGAA